MTSEFPIRCFSCNKIIANKLIEYETLLQKGTTKELALNKILITRYCCRRMFLSYDINIAKNINSYEKNSDTSFEENF